MHLTSKYSQIQTTYLGRWPNLTLDDFLQLHGIVTDGTRHGTFERDIIRALFGTLGFMSIIKGCVRNPQLSLDNGQ